jgi:inward rectifier potassium channel
MPRPSDLPAGARRFQGQDATFWVVGDERAILRDAYHTFLRMPWWGSLLLIATGFFIANVAFAVVYLFVGGIGGARDGSFIDALSFSVQTMSTIGYGVMHPDSGPATAVMIVESLFSIIVTALATGLVFAKFSRPTTRVAFSKYAVVTKHEGKSTLMFRVGNRRSNVIVEATIHVVAYMTKITAEGETFYSGFDLKLVRDRQVGMTRGWTVMHVIDDASPLVGVDAAAAVKAELDLYIALTGIDDTTKQSIHTVHYYPVNLVQFGHRFVDTLSVLADGSYLVDQRNFDRTVPDTTARDSVAP